MARDLSGQRVLITGASSGIGRCLAQQAAAAGTRVALVSRTAEKLNELAAQVAPATEVLVIPADVTSDADRRHLLDVTTRIRALDGVLETESFPYLELWKQLYDWGTGGRETPKGNRAEAR